MGTLNGTPVPLYFVQHKHDAATYPAQNAKVAPQLLQLLAAAPSAGVTILGEAVVDGGHELNIIATADDARRSSSSWRPSRR